MYFPHLHKDVSFRLMSINSSYVNNSGEKVKRLISYQPFKHTSAFLYGRPHMWLSVLKTSWEKEKMLLTAFSPFPKLFSTL